MKNSIRDARTPQPGEIVFNTMRYRSSETVQRSGYFQSLDKILKVKVTTARSNVTSRSHHDITHLQPPTNVPTEYQLPTPYAF